jgi:hypothetical protein
MRMIITLMVLLVSGMSSLSFAQPTTPETAIIYPAAGKGITHEGPAPDTIIQKANEYVINFVGEEYFNSYISLNDSYRTKCDPELYEYACREDTYTVVYFYDIPVKNVFNRYFSVGIDSDGDVSSIYEGPKKAYKFLITKEQAIEIAMQNGIENPVEGYINYAFGPCDTTKPLVREGDQERCAGIEEWVWEVYEYGRAGVGRETVYIDVDTGEVLGKSIDTGVRESEGGGSIRHPTPPRESEIRLNELLIPVTIIIIILILAVIGFIYYKKK